MEFVLQFGLLVVGFLMLSKGADWFVDGASGIAARFGISQLIIGLTIVAMGTSAPEAAVSIAAAFKGSGDITIGNIVGSNILNILVILGVSSVITALAVASSTVRVEIPFMTVITVLLFWVGYDGNVNFFDGIILLTFFVVYLIYLYIAAKKGIGDENAEEFGTSLSHCIIFSILGMALILLGSEATVSAAKSIAAYAGLSERFIGLTIVALGTSLPELFTSVVAARRGNADIAIGNIVGSNIFNILFVVGISALVTPVQFSKAFIFDAYVAIAAALLLFVCVIASKKLERWAGAVMLLAYVSYIYYIL